MELAVADHIFFLALPSGTVAVPGAAEVGGTGAAVGTEVGAKDVVVVVAIIIFVIIPEPNTPLH